MWTALAVWWAGVPVCAQTPTIDLELLRPTFGSASLLGVDVASTDRPGTWRLGALTQYERDPLTLRDAVGGHELGAVVTHRAAFGVGASVDVSRRATLDLLLPGAAHWGSELSGTQHAALAGDGAGFGDLGGGLRLALVRAPRDRVTAGLRVGGMLPTSGGAWLGERSPRAHLGGLASVDVGPLRIATDARVQARAAVVLDEDLALGTEVHWASGARLGLPAATRLALTAQILARTGLSSGSSGGAGDPWEALTGLQLRPGEDVTIGLAAGRGLTEGYGTTDLRLVSALQVRHRARRPDPTPTPSPPELAWPPLEDDGPLLVPEPEDTEIVDDRLVVRDRIAFRVGTAELLPSSEPVLDAIAQRLHDTPRIAHLLVEGHASREGSHLHNYELAEARAARIWRELQARGVARQRLSHRGVGEVEPRAAGDDEHALQQNRRVELHILVQLGPDDPLPTWPERQELPWSGQVVDVVQPHD